MTLSKRELILAVAAAATLALLLLNAYVLGPYLQTSGLVNEQSTAARLKLSRDLRLLQDRARVARAWHTLRTEGLTRDAGAAENETLQSLLQYAHEAGVRLRSLQPTRLSPSHDFRVIRVEATGESTTASLALFMWCIETSTLPLQLESVHMAPQKPGTDDLTFQMSVGTLVYAPKSSKSNGNGSGT